MYSPNNVIDTKFMLKYLYFTKKTQTKSIVRFVGHDYRWAQKSIKQIPDPLPRFSASL